MLIKGARLGMIPAGPDQTIKQMYHMIGDVRAKGVYYSLDRYCYDRFDLGRFGADRTSSHRAYYDAWETHLVLECLREIAEEE